jgi:hypothetical protein
LRAGPGEASWLCPHNAAAPCSRREMVATDGWTLERLVHCCGCVGADVNGGEDGATRRCDEPLHIAHGQFVQPLPPSAGTMYSRVLPYSSPRWPAPATGSQPHRPSLEKLGQRGDPRRNGRSPGRGTAEGRAALLQLITNLAAASGNPVSPSQPAISPRSSDAHSTTLLPFGSHLLRTSRLPAKKMGSSPRMVVVG